MSGYGLLIHYEWCTGCHSCEMACQMEHGYPIGQTGIKLQEIGPWKIEEDYWQYDYVPVPTNQCDLCEDRMKKGASEPTCVKHCQAACMQFGKLEDLFEYCKAEEKTVLFHPKN